MKPRARSQRGQAMVEYIVVMAVALAVMVYPYEDGKSVLTVLMEAMRTCWAKFLANLSLPI